MNIFDTLIKSVQSKLDIKAPILIAMDFDGTLAPFAPTPDLAFIPTVIRERLSTLATLPYLRLAIISGRPIQQLKDLINIGNIWLAGSGGLTIQTSLSFHEYPSMAYINGIINDMAIRITYALDKFPGAWIESKPGTLTVHFRQLNKSLQPSLFKCIAYLIAVEEKLESTLASQAIEIRPRCGWHKGTALEIMRQELWASGNNSPYIVYFGDSANDREAFDCANRFGGISIGVGFESPSNSLLKVGSCSDVWDFLQLLCSSRIDNYELSNKCA
jgi:trehalose 6-phosphate phosphatase